MKLANGQKLIDEKVDAEKLEEKELNAICMH